MWDPILYEQPWQKFRNCEESNFYHILYTVLILRLQICFYPVLISCVEEIFENIEGVEVGFNEFFAWKPEITVAG